MEEVVPPARRYELGQNDGDVITRMFRLELLEVFEQRFHQRSELRRQHHERHTSTPSAPIGADLGGRGRIDVHTYGAHVWRQGARIFERVDDGALHSAYGDDHP